MEFVVKAALSLCCANASKTMATCSGHCPLSPADAITCAAQYGMLCPLRQDPFGGACANFGNGGAAAVCARNLGTGQAIDVITGPLALMSVADPVLDHELVWEGL
jgi:hypothetical protein